MYHVHFRLYSENVNLTTDIFLIYAIVVAMNQAIIYSSLYMLTGIDVRAFPNYWINPLHSKQNCTPSQWFLNLLPNQAKGDRVH